MSRRIDIELTSNRGDGTWTWRAAGAKQPKGVVAATLLPSDATVGQQMRADVETTLDGTDVLAVAPPKAKNRAVAETIELIPRGGDEPLVTQTLVGRRGGDRGDRRDRGDRGDRGPRGDRPGGRGREGGPRGDRPGGDRGPSGPRGDRPGAGRGDRPSGGPRGDRPAGERGPRGERPDRPRRERPAAPPKPKAKRLRPGRTHRKVALEALSSEEQVIAEQLLAGGIPGLRQAIEKQNAQAKADDTRAVSAAPLLVIAERLWPSLRSAEWRDRAEAALADLDELDLRDLRSVVVAADGGAKDEEARALATQLRDGLTHRLDQEQAAWLAELSETLREGRVVRALRLSSRPPKAGAPLPADLSAKLAEATSASLTAETVTDRWATVLDALSFSPARLTVVPTSKPAEPSPELISVITRMADRVPKVAEAFGIDPASVPARRSRGGKAGAGRRPGGKPGAATAKAGGGAKGRSKAPVPPPPPLAETPAAQPPAVDAATEPVASTEVPTAPAAPTEPTEPTPTDVAAPANERPANEAPSVEAAATEAASADVDPGVEPAPTEAPAAASATEPTEPEPAAATEPTEPS